MSWAGPRTRAALANYLGYIEKIFRRRTGLDLVLKELWTSAFKLYWRVSDRAEKTSLRGRSRMSRKNERQRVAEFLRRIRAVDQAIRGALGATQTSDIATSADRLGRALRAGAPGRSMDINLLVGYWVLVGSRNDINQPDFVKNFLGKMGP